MKMIIKGNRMLLVVLVLFMAVCFTGCTLDDGTRETKGSEVQRETEEEAEEAEKEKEKTEKQLQIRKLEGITLDDKEAKLPYNIKMYNEATEAFKNPVRIHMKKDKERMIFFSCVKSKDFSVYYIKDGLIVEQDESCDGSDYKGPKTVGNIQIFSLELPIVNEPCTVLYEIVAYCDKNPFIAFYMIPE